GEGGGLGLERDLVSGDGDGGDAAQEAAILGADDDLARGERGRAAVQDLEAEASCGALDAVAQEAELCGVDDLHLLGDVVVEHGERDGGGASLDGCGDGGASRSHTGHDAGLADAEHGLVAAAPGDGAAGELLAGGAE